MNLFLEACGAASPLVWSVEGPGPEGPASLTLEAPFAIVGRNAAADLVLSGPDVCGRHAYMQLIAGRLYGIDLGSPNGLSWDGVRRGSGWVDRRQAFQVGPHRVRLIAGEADGSTPAPEEPALPLLSLDVMLRGVRPVRLEAPSELTLVGSSNECQIRLLDPGVSNFHCSLIQTQAGVWVVDLLGQGGVAVNGSAVRFALVEEGDEIVIGRTKIKIRLRREEIPAQRTAAPPEPPVVKLKARPAPPASSTETAPQSDGVLPPLSKPAELVKKPEKKRTPVVPTPQPDSGRERRGSFRYPLPETRAQLAWWEKAPVVTVAPRLTESTVVEAFRSRGPAFRAGIGQKRDAAEFRREAADGREVLVTRGVSIRMVDVSQSGLSAKCDETPPDGQRLWFRVESDPKAHWVEVVAVGEGELADGERLLRYAFPDDCPYDLFKALVFESKALEN